MTRKFSRNSLLGVAVPLIAILIVSVAFVALAQMPGAGQRPGQNAVVSAQQETGVPSQALQYPLLKATSNAQRASVTRSHKNEPGAVPMDGIPPLFLPAVNYNTGPGSSPNAVAIGDLRGDGKMDVVEADYDSNVEVLLGNGDGTLQPPVIYPSGGSVAWAVSIADVNGDGKPDLVVTSQYGSQYGPSLVGVLLGNGDGTFQPVVTYSAEGSAAYSVTVGVADLRGDGIQDLIVVNQDAASGCCDGSVAVLLGNGDGTFQPAASYGSGGLWPFAMAVADVNGDGKPDIVVSNSCAALNPINGLCNGDGGVGVLLGNGDGTLQAAVTYDSGGVFAEGIAVADVNGDGKPDVVVANGYSDDVVGVLLGIGDGTFQPPVTYLTAWSFAWSVAIADVNGDGKPDIVVTNMVGEPDGDGEALVLLGNGDGTFQPVVGYDTGEGGTWGVAVGDLNGDGLPDLAVANGSEVGVLLHTPRANTSTTTTVASSLNPAGTKQVVTYTASVTSQDGGVVTGAVTFQDGGTTVAMAPVANNQAAYSTSYTKPGAHRITAVYPGDWEDAGSTSAKLTEHVESYPSTTALATSGSPSFVGQPVTFTATVTSTHGTIPAGELLTFYDGPAKMGSVALSVGTAAYTTSTLSAKTHNIKAVYAGDAFFRPSSGAVEQVVNKYATTTTLTSSPDPSQFGQAVTFTAQVTSSGPTPTGKVRFFDSGSLLIGSGILRGGEAELTWSRLLVGRHTITAEYSGDLDNDKNTSPVLDQVVQ